MSLTTEETALYTQYLKEAEEALHQLSMGRRVAVVVDENGERVEYSGANRNDLMKYIQDLKGKLGKFSTCGPLGTFI